MTTFVFKCFLIYLDKAVQIAYILKSAWDENSLFYLVMFNQIVISGSLQ